jgi:1-phosphatidylinositol-4-phosphate 5-kinase
MKNCRSAVPAKSGRGDRLLLYFGIIDILQSYRLKKRLEHTFKSMITDGVIYRIIIHFDSLRAQINFSKKIKSQISVCHPKHYATRFIDFMTTKVFKKASKILLKITQF